MTGRIAGSRLCLIVVFVVLPVVGSPLSVATQPIDQAMIDLAAMTPIPGDVPGDDPGLRLGAMQSLDRALEDRWFGGIDHAATTRVLDESGWQRRYTSALYFAGPADAAGGGPERVAVSGVAEFDDAAGAAAWFAYVTGDAFRVGPIAVEAVAGGPTVGNEARLVRLDSPAFTADEGEAPGEVLWLIFRRDRIVADVWFSDTTAEPLTVADVGALAGAFARRVDAVLTAGDPLPGALALRLEAHRDVSFYWPLEGYLHRDGSTLAQAGESPDSVAYRRERYGAARDVYSLETMVQVGAERAPATDPNYHLMLLRFDGVDEAAAWVAGVPAFLADHGIEAERIADAAVFGDESLTLSVPFVRTGTDEALRSSVVVLRVGDVAALIEIAAPAATPRDAVEALAAAQAACLLAGACPDPAPVPSALLGAPPA